MWMGADERNKKTVSADISRFVLSRLKTCHLARAPDYLSLSEVLRIVARLRDGVGQHGLQCVGTVHSRSIYNLLQNIVRDKLTL